MGTTEHFSDLPYIQRDNQSPKGDKSQYRIIDVPSSVQEITKAADKGIYTKGQAELAKVFLFYGSTAEFPGGIGLQYDNVFKGTITSMIQPRIRELAEEVKQSGIDIDCILTSDYSGIAPSAMLGLLLEKDVVRIRKKDLDEFDPSHAVFAVRVDSYTGNGGDVLTLEKKRFSTTFDRLGIQEARVLFVDEILDTGTIIRAIHEMSGWSTSTDYPFSLTGAVFILEKTYTGAADIIHKEMGIPTFSGLSVEDLGLDPAWVKLSGIEPALCFAGKA